jgi:uncharacterized protein involved in exopolysaccharide biosynthesis
VRFVEGFFRHRVLAIVLLGIAFFVFVSYELFQPRSYSATTSILVDTTGPGSAQYNSPTGFPAGTLQNDLQEFLNTQNFVLSVAHRGPLAAYVAAHPYALGTGMRAIPGVRSLFGSMGSVDDEIISFLPGMIALNPVGNTVLNVTVSGPTPQVAAGTAQALVQGYTAEVTAAQTASDQVAVTFYGQQLAQAKATLGQAQAQLSAYMATHPAAAPQATPNANPTTQDPTAIELNQAATVAATTYNNVVSAYETAQYNLADVGNQTGFSVIDAAAPGVSTSVKGKLIEMGFIGLLVGLIIDVLIIGVIVNLDRSARSAHDIRRVLGAEVAGEIIFVPPAARASSRGHA